MCACVCLESFILSYLSCLDCLLQAFQEYDPYSMIARLEVLLETSSQNGHQVSEDVQSVHSGNDSNFSEASSTLHSTPQVSIWSTLQTGLQSTVQVILWKLDDIPGEHAFECVDSRIWVFDKMVQTCFTCLLSDTVCHKRQQMSPVCENKDGVISYRKLWTQMKESKN